MLTDGMAQRLMASGDLDDEALAVTRRNIALRRFGDAIDIAEAAAVSRQRSCGLHQRADARRRRWLRHLMHNVGGSQ